MLKLISLMKRKEGMSFEEFRRWITEEHPAYAKKLPGLRKYTVNILKEENPDSPFDAVNEMWFDNAEARAAAFASDAGKAAGADAIAHASHRVHLVTDEHPQFGH